MRKSTSPESNITPAVGPLPGLLACAAVGGSGILLARIVPDVGSVTLALLLGIAAGNLVPMRHLDEGVRFAEKRLLPLAIALLGVELQLQLLGRIGIEAIVLIVLVVTLTVLVALSLGRMMGFSRDFSLLIGAGNGICGSSAIAAVGTATGAGDRDIGLSIGAVNLMGTVGIVLLPLLASLFGFGELRSGALIGGSLQAVGQVAAAGFAVSAPVGNIAILVKMGRVLMLGPLVILVTLIRRRSSAPAGIREGTRPAAPLVPPFIIGFFGASVLASSGLLPAGVVPATAFAGKTLLVVAMAGIGMRIRFAELLRQGPRIMLFEAAVAALQIGLAATLVLLLLR